MAEPIERGLGWGALVEALKPGLIYPPTLTPVNQQTPS